MKSVQIVGQIKSQVLHRDFTPIYRFSSSYGLNFNKFIFTQLSAESSRRKRTKLIFRSAFSRRKRCFQRALWCYCLKLTCTAVLMAILRRHWSSVMKEFAAATAAMGSLTLSKQTYPLSWYRCLFSHFNLYYAHKYDK